MDFVDQTGPLYFDHHQSIACVNISIYDDDITEANETFKISASVDANVNYSFVSPREVTMIIVDTDCK